MGKVKSTQPEESVFNGFKHPMLKLLLKGTGEQPDMRHLRGVIEEILSERVDTNSRLETAAELERLIPNDNDQTSSRQALLEEAFAEMARRFPLPRVTELLCETYLQAGKVRIGFDDNISVHQDMPSFWRSGSGIDLHEVRPPTRCLNAWACAVASLSTSSSQQLDSLEQEDLLAGIRLLQVHLLFRDEAKSFGVGRGALTLFEGQGLCLWNELLARVTPEARSQPGFERTYGHRRQKAFWQHFRGHAALESLATEHTPNASEAAPDTRGTWKSMPGWHVVIPGTIPPATQEDDRDAMKRFEALQRPIPVARLPSSDELARIERTLAAEFPWATDAVEALIGELQTRSLFGGVQLGTVPTLLVGPPGSGKSRLVHRIAEALQVRCCPLALAGMNDSMALTGTSRGWSTGQASPLIASMLQTRNASTLVLLDEIDKVGASARNSVPPTVALLNLLEPENAKHWYDTYLQTPCDLSTLMFWATANALSPLSKPLLSRFRVVLVPEPRPEHFRAIVEGVVVDIENKWRLPKDTLRELAPMIPVHRTRNVREVQHAVTAFLRNWATANLGRANLH